MTTDAKQHHGVRRRRNSFPSSLPPPPPRARPLVGPGPHRLSRRPYGAARAASDNDAGACATSRAASMTGAGISSATRPRARRSASRHSARETSTTASATSAAPPSAPRPRRRLQQPRRTRNEARQLLSDAGRSNAYARVRSRPRPVRGRRYAPTSAPSPNLQPPSERLIPERQPTQPPQRRGVQWPRTFAPVLTTVGSSSNHSSIRQDARAPDCCGRWS